MTELKRKLDYLDAMFTTVRQQLVIELARSGKISKEEFCSLFAAQTRPDVVEEDRRAFEEGSDDSPTTRLALLLFRLKPSEPPRR